MFLTYYDESGDDGYPEYSSTLFVLSAVYLHHLDWKPCFEKIRQFRKELFQKEGLPFNTELHTKQFLLGKKPYRDFGWTPQDRLRILQEFCEMVANLNLRIINVAIDKLNITSSKYPVLDRAFTYSIQRIENDLRQDGNRFLIITDEGRVGKMRTTSRRVQHFNPIPSQFSDQTYQKEVEHLIEDPLPKNSKESFFIQIADMVSYLVSLYLRADNAEQHWPNRLKSDIQPSDIENCLEILKPSLNLKASRTHPYGIVCYPKTP